MIGDQELDADPLDLIEDLDRVLNPNWRDEFLAFMDMSHLKPERLLVWGQALLAAYPADPSQVDRRHPLTLEAIKRWQSKMYSDAQLTQRAARIEEIEASTDLACFLTTAPIIHESDESEEGDYIQGTLIVAFEHRTETLAHHIIRHEISAGDVLNVAHKLVKTASGRRTITGAECQRHLFLPQRVLEDAWCSDLHVLFWKNILTVRDQQKAPPSFYLPEGFERVANSDVIEISLHGRPIRIRHDLWIPGDYEVVFPPRNMTCDSEEGTNALHDILAKASRKVRELLAKTTVGNGPKPTWKGFSRARWSQFDSTSKIEQQ